MIIFLILGGIGKHIAATAVIKAIHRAFPSKKIVVICYYTEIFQNNPYAYKVHKINLIKNVYDTYIKNNDILYFSEEVYSSTEFLIEDKHLIQAWCECIGIKYNNELPEIYFSQEELKCINKFQKNKPILVLQTKATNSKEYNWTTDIPHEVVQGVIDHFYHEYDIYHIHNKAQKGFNNSCAVTTSNIRELLFLIKISDKRLGVNSFMQHAAAALNLPSLIYWVFTPCKKYGYSIHNNIEPKDYNFEYYKNFEFFNGHVGYPDISNCNLNLDILFLKEKIINNLA